MWILFADPKKYGLLPPGTHLIFEEVKFYNNIAACPKFYYQKILRLQGVQDITPKLLIRRREKRDLRFILVIAKGGIGDVMWTLPFIQTLKRKFPSSQIAVLTDERGLPVFKNCPYITTAIKEESWTTGNLLKTAEEIYEFGGVATIYPELQKLDPVEAIHKIAGMKMSKLPKDNRPHLVLTAEEGNIALQSLEKNGVNPRTDQIVILSLESSTPNRDWPLSSWEKLSSLLARPGRKIIWLAEKTELEDVGILTCRCGWSAEIRTKSEIKNISYTCPACGAAVIVEGLQKVAGVVNYAGKTSLRESWSLIALADLFIGPNSSGMVAATALEIPTIGLFGAFDHRRRTKFYEKFTAIQGGAKCAPCEEHWTECREGHPAPCMRDITPELVAATAEKMILQFPRAAAGKLPTK